MNILTILLMILMLPLNSFASSWWKNAKDFNFGQNKSSIYGGLQFGFSSLDTDKDNEAGSKEGSQYGLTFGTLLEYSLIDLNIGLNYYYLNFESEREDDLKFNLESRAIALEASPLYNTGAFSFGPKIQMVLLDPLLVGPSDDSDENAESLTTRFVLGVNGFYTMPWNEKNLRFGAHFQKPISIGPRDAQIFLLSIEIGKILN